MALPVRTAALPVDTYAPASVLASGHWVKIAVESDGMYLIPNARLRAWGFSDPSKVVIRGYGGRRLSDELSAATYTDDLPAVQSVVTDKGILFYGVGAGMWKESQQNGYFYYRQSDYSAAGHYFVGLRDEGEEPRDIPARDLSDNISDPATTYMAFVQHEQEERLTVGEAGPMLVGEDFKSSRRRKFTFDLTDAVPGGKGWFQSSFVSNHRDTNGRLAIAVNGTEIPYNTTFRLSPTAGEHVYGAVNQGRASFTMPDNTSGHLEIELEMQLSATPTNAWLNYLAVNYERYLRLPAAGHLSFASGQAAFSFDAAGKDIVVWDVTDPMNISAVNYGKPNGGGRAEWSFGFFKRRNMAVWSADGSFPEPAVVGAVANQNLHGIENCDMVIVAPSNYTSDAQRLADYHISSIDSLATIVVTPEAIYNEFSSGTLDPGGIRRFFKMLYDRGNATGRPLRYALLMARTTLDNKRLSPTAPNHPTIPSWTPEEEAYSVSDNTGYCTDDIMAMLADGSGIRKEYDALSIAIGRLPIVSATESRQVVDKLLQYARGANRSAWKHRFMYLADDQNGGIHLTDSEMQIKNSEANPFLVNKVYMDAYELIGSEYPEARNDMFRYLEEGVVWWNFIGHASTTGWTHEHQLSYTDLNNMYLRHWPFIYAATCDFLRLDGSDISGGEILFKERYGGAMGIFSAVRPVYIPKNSYLTAAMGRALALRDDKGMILPPGEICRLAKNDLRTTTGDLKSDDNRLRYTFVGDPALRLAVPSNLIKIDSINGIALDADEQPTLAALQQCLITGYVTDPFGNVLDGFNGVLMADIFDAERSVTTLGHGENGVKSTFETHGGRIFTGSAIIENGRFSLRVAMPLELEQNFRPATMSLYAYDTDDDTEAVGLCNEFYVYGLDETVEDDIISPEIETLYLNHDDFRNGDVVNTSPMLIAALSDNIGINVSNAGIGHQIVAVLDGRETFTGLANYYTPASDGSPAGTVNYPMEDLQPGAHSLTLKVWDTAGNSAQKTIDFSVAEGVAPKIYDVYTDANPASTVANFYLRHNQPDNMVTVTISVYNLLGRLVWSNTVSGRSDMFLSMPVTWDLTDLSGRRVDRGIYLYRASITSDGANFETASQRIAVTAR